MNDTIRSARVFALACVAAAVAFTSAVPRSALAASAAELRRDSAAALNRLYAQQHFAKTLAPKAKGILCFPSIVKAGFMFGGQMGEGVMRKGGRVTGYYNSVAASYGLQAGVQKFGYAIFFLSEGALKQLDAADGFEVGIGPSIVVVDEGMGKSMTSTTLRGDAYAFIFSQKGLMGGMGLQGSKITKINK